MPSSKWQSPSFLLGLLFIVVSAWIFAGSSAVVQYLYSSEFDSPFLITYLGVSLFCFLLPFKYVTDRWTAQVHHCVPIPIDTSDKRDVFAPHHKIAAAAWSTGIWDPQMEAVASTLSECSRSSVDPWSNRQHMVAALQIAPFWWIANWSFNAALSGTSLASSIVISSTCSVFAFLLAVFYREENFSWMTFMSLILGMLGTALTAWHDAKDMDLDSSCVKNCDDALWGDLLALVSAVGFGINAIQIRLLCPADEALYSMTLLLGYVGLFNTVFWAPVALWKLWMVHDLTWTVVSLIFVRGFFEYVVSVSEERGD
jgi:solute carrier family 35 protein F5